MSHILDIGSGPLTFPIALYLSRPDLRDAPLRFVCADRSKAALAAGKKIFEALAGEQCKWKISTIAETYKSLLFNTMLKEKGPFHCITAINFFNELYGSLALNDRAGMETLAAREAAFLARHITDGGSVLIVEPGNPRGGEFISLARDGLLREGCAPLTPCTHCGECPMPARKNVREKNAASKWCHFAFNTLDAPPALRALSAKCGLEKDRASLSFLLGVKKNSTANCNAASGLCYANNANGVVNNSIVRVISEAFSVPEGWGRYGCSARGLVLVLSGRADDLQSGDAVTLAEHASLTARDPRSGALLARDWEKAG
jgi:hypothetical protein